MTPAEFLDKALTIDDPDILFAAYRDALKEFGVDRILYSALRNTPYEEFEVPGISHCYPEDWIAYYMAHDYVHVDPVRLHCLNTRGAFTWQDMMVRRKLSPEQELLMNQGEEAGLHNGLAVPFHGPMGETYGVGMASSMGNPDIIAHVRAIQALSTCFHQFYSELHRGEEIPQPKAQLTPRELEVLKWAAIGKSNWAIGEILSISEHGVDFHMRNILRKLDADTRITAVVKALHAGLLSL